MDGLFLYNELRKLKRKVKGIMAGMDELQREIGELKAFATSFHTFKHDIEARLAKLESLDAATAAAAADLSSVTDDLNATLGAAPAPAPVPPAEPQV